MRLSLKACVVAAALTVFVSLAGAATITIESGSATGSCLADPGAGACPGGSAVTDLGNASAAGFFPPWGPTLDTGEWISDLAGTEPGGGVLHPVGTVSFFHNFTIGALETVNSFSLTVLGDDRVDVFYDGFAINTTVITLGSPCNQAVIGCIDAFAKTFVLGDFLAVSTFTPGLHKLEFRVTQGTNPDTGGGFGAFGLNYDGAIDTTVVPEPTTVLLMGIGLVALGVIRRRRAK